jgi:3-phosphoshikimate 1-carboxyvinyltransferase
MIDEYPALAIAAAAAEGATNMAGIGELRVKESDRLAAIVAGLTANGVAVESGADWLKVTGGPVKGGGTVATHHDHRIAMAFLCLGLAPTRRLRLMTAPMIATSFPNFFPLMKDLGADIDG